EKNLVGPQSGSTATHLALTYSPTSYRLQRQQLFPASSSPGLETFDQSYDYDPVGNVRSVTDNSPFTGPGDFSYGASYTYDARNRLATSTAGNQTQYFTYDKVGNLLGKGVTSAGQTNQNYSNPQRPHLVTQNYLGINLTYDADGNLAQRLSHQFP